MPRLYAVATGIRSSNPTLDMALKIISIIPVCALLKNSVILMMDVQEDNPLEKKKC